MKRLFLLLALFLLCGCSSAQVDVTKLKVPPGFRVSIFADTKAKPRLMAVSPGGVLLVTATSDGLLLALPDANKDSQADRVASVLTDLDAPHGIAFYQGKLYIAETGRVVRYDWNEAQLSATNPQEIVKLPRGGGHFTRTIVFHNGKMYVAAGSSCNVCDDEHGRAMVQEFNPDGSGGRVFARGLRNSVGLDVSPVTKTIWASDNGRDWLGDNLPPDELNNLGDGGDFGWPFCYGKRVVDAKYPGSSAARCGRTIPSAFDLPAHSAALGIAFYTGTAFPQPYRNDLFVAFHGSWNRSVPTGYKVVRVRMNARGEATAVEDFLAGFVSSGETRRGKWSGRPVGVTVAPDGSLFVSDDTSGAIYRVAFTGQSKGN
ncbi:MAG TPA: PQQ-dependent sugar dehydrogenase [Terriglobales bacterium]|nr:PQQ-dependent sugar dehydrogenase [Terriglobales bacterium]